MTNTTTQSEQAGLEVTLVHRAQAGDSDAFDLLVKRYRSLLFALAFLRTSHTEEAEDLVLVYPNGEPFSPQMKRMGIFPDFAVAMIRIGEENGTLHTIMHSLAESFEDDLEYQTLP